MAVSIEALAMAGVDCNQWGLDIEKWEADDDSEWPPPHLLAEGEEEEEPERVAKRGFQVTGTSSLTNSSEDFDGDSDDINANKGATLECRNGRVSHGRALVERIIHCLRSTKPMVRYIIHHRAINDCKHCSEEEISKVILMPCHENKLDSDYFGTRCPS